MQHDSNTVQPIIPRLPWQTYSAGLPCIGITLATCVGLFTAGPAHADLGVYRSGHELIVSNSYDSIRVVVPPEQLASPVDTSLEASMIGASADANIMATYDASQLTMNVDIRQWVQRFDNVANDFSYAHSDHVFMIRPTQDILVTVTGLVGANVPADGRVAALLKIYEQEVEDPWLFVGAIVPSPGGEQPFAGSVILPAGGDYSLFFEFNTDAFDWVPLDTPISAEVEFELSLVVVPEPAALVLSLVLFIPVVLGTSSNQRRRESD